MVYENLHTLLRSQSFGICCTVTVNMMDTLLRSSQGIPVGELFKYVYKIPNTPLIIGALQIIVLMDVYSLRSNGR